MASSPYANFQPPRKGKKPRKPEGVHDRPTALTKRQQQEQADARREAAAQTPKGALARQRNIIAQEKAREPARYRADVRRQVANPSIADKLAEGFFRGAVQAPLYTNLPGAAIGQAYALMPEERGKAPTGRGELLGIALGHVGGMASRGRGLPPEPKPKSPPPDIRDYETARGELLAAAKRSSGPVKGESGKFEPGLYNQQADLRRQERGKRFDAAAAAREEAGGGRAGSYAALGKLKGALPRLRTGPLNLDEATEAALFNQISRNPDLMQGEIVSAEKALRDLLDGKVLAPRQWKWIEDLFGKDVAREAIGNLPLEDKIKRELLGALNIPRALKSTGDLSLMFRQVLVAGARHPKLWARTWRPMAKAGLKEQHYNVVMDDIASNPYYDDALEDGLSLTDLESMVRREEGYMSDRAEQIPLGVGRLVRASGRAFTAGGNLMRMWMYALMRETHPNMSKEERSSMVSWINAATGRGAKQGGHFQQNAQVYNGLLFSPQLVASRIKVLNPFWYTGVPKIHKGLQGPARTEALRGMIQLGTAAAATLFMVDEAADQLGWGDRVSVELDPRSSDWGKIRVGDTRIDILGGLGQYIVLYSRLAMNEYKRADGAIIPYEGGYGGASRYQAGLNFAENKLAPVPSIAVDAGKGENFDREPFDPRKEIPRLFLPLGFEATADSYREYGPAIAALTFGLGGVGFGVQTYSEAKKKSGKSGKSSGDSPYAGRSKKGRSPYATGRGGGRSPYAGG